jgi:hypothetical protein
MKRQAVSNAYLRIVGLTGTAACPVPFINLEGFANMFLH